MRPMSPCPVLFIENSVGLSGSTVSLVTLLNRVDRRRFEPYVVLSRPEQAAFLGQHLHEPLDMTVIAPRIGLKHSRWCRAVLGASGSTGQEPRHTLLRIAGLLDLLLVTLPYALRLRRFARERRVAMIHQNNGFDFGAVFLARMLGLPLVAYQRGAEWNSPIVRRFARHVTYFIANSAATRQSLDALGVPPGKVSIIYPPLDLDLFTERVSPASVRASLGLECGTLSFGIVGMLVPWKGHPVFLRAARRILDRLPNALGVVVGGPPPGYEAYAEHLRDLARDLGIADRLVFAGFRHDVPQVLSALDVVVHASVEPEPFGRVIAEAMAMKRPVVASAAGGPLEIIEDGRSGFLVPPGDHEGLARRVIEVLEDPVRAAEVAEQGFREAVGRFSAGEHARLVQDVYDAVLRASHGARGTAVQISSRADRHRAAKE
jgi:glycosyltransferase involved in cell wall biosynthesis